MTSNRKHKRAGPGKYLAARTQEASDGVMYLPPPGLNGDYADTCVVCFLGTDTGLAFRGEGEWLAAGLKVLGIPMDQAISMVSQRFDMPRGQVPGGSDHVMVIKVCAECVGRTEPNFPAPGLMFEGAQIPCVGQPPEAEVA